ncbi:uncharacterized protein [Cicer arietinum]|uniref:uncharacterized protein n=1 Tax=Cicer arietinum TaxID=3827 RepID=UPI003CC67DCE
MRSLLGAQEVFEIVQDGYEQLGANPTERQQTTFKDCKKRDCKALFYIQQSVDSNNFERISKVSTSKEAWDIFVKYYTGDEKTKKVKLQMLRRQYELLQMEEDEDVANYFNRVQVVVNQMRTNGESLTEVVIIEKILRTLTKAQVSKKTNQGDVKHKKGKGNFKWYKKYDSDEETDDSDEGSRSSRNHNKSDNSNKNLNGKKKFNKKEIQCYNCKKWGHFANECKSKKVQREDDDAQMAVENSDSEDVLLMTITSEDRFGKSVKNEDRSGKGVKNKERSSSQFWFLDSGCSNHMTGHKDWFVSIDEKVKREIRFADSSKVTAEGVGNVLIQRNDGKQYFICDVLFVPRMKNNLLSLGQLLEKGFSMKMKHGEIKMFDSANRFVLKAPLSRNRIFKTTLSNRSSRIMEVEGLDAMLNPRDGDVSTPAIQPHTTCKTTNQWKTVNPKVRAKVVVGDVERGNKYANVPATLAIVPSNRRKVPAISICRKKEVIGLDDDSDDGKSEVQGKLVDATRTHVAAHSNKARVVVCLACNKTELQ